MPELPEVETVCRGLAKALVGARIIAAVAHRADLRAPLPVNLGNQLKGCRIVSVARRAKYILITLDNGQTLLLHLGMSGRMVLSTDDAPLHKHDHISLAFDNGLHARFNDPRRFGLCDLVDSPALDHHKLLRSLGVEPLSEAFTPDVLSSLLDRRKTSIKVALLDQRLVVGIGNIYACESLFSAGIHPERAAGSLKPAEIKKLTASIRTVLQAAIAAGGSSLRDYVQTDGQLGYFQHQFAVYGREDAFCSNCDCASLKKKGIRRITQSGRSTFFCPQRQV